MANNSPISTSSLECTSHLQTYIPHYHLLSLGDVSLQCSTAPPAPALPTHTRPDAPLLLQTLLGCPLVVLQWFWEPPQWSLYPSFWHLRPFPTSPLPSSLPITDSHHRGLAHSQPPHPAAHWPGLEPETQSGPPGPLPLSALAAQLTFLSPILTTADVGPV